MNEENINYNSEEIIYIAQVPSEVFSGAVIRNAIRKGELPTKSRPARVKKGDLIAWLEKKKNKLKEKLTVLDKKIEIVKKLHTD